MASEKGYFCYLLYPPDSTMVLDFAMEFDLFLSLLKEIEPDHGVPSRH